MLQKSTILGVASVFFREPTKAHYLTEISKNINLAHTSVKRDLDELVVKEILLVKNEERGTRLFPVYYANLNSDIYKKEKIIYNISAIYSSGLIEFLRDELMPNSIIIFGSFLRAEDTEESDIDLFVEAKQEEVNLLKYEKILNRKIQLHFQKNFKNYPKELKNSILNGFTLYGFLEGFN